MKKEHKGMWDKRYVEEWMNKDKLPTRKRQRKIEKGRECCDKREGERV